MQGLTPIVAMAVGERPSRSDARMVSKLSWAASELSWRLVRQQPNPGHSGINQSSGRCPVQVEPREAILKQASFPGMADGMAAPSREGWKWGELGVG